MYRVTAEAVSGTNVYAGGKWLKCIGNKPVHVGERVWTDGRCVFGNYQESQQPPVIISQEEEIIPIATDEGYFIFSKRKLKTCEAENPLTNYKFFINNKRANCYFVENYLGLYPSANVYGYYAFEASATSPYVSDLSLTVDHDDYSCDLKGILAADVDVAGNLFAINIDQLTLKIIKNTATVKKVDLENLIKKANALVSMPASPSADSGWGESGDPLAPGDWMIWHLYRNGIDLQVNYAFIENENNWIVYMEFFVHKSAETTHGDWEERNSNKNETFINCYLSNSETKLNIGESVSTPDPDYKLALQDGYHFTEKRSGDNVLITIYSPNETQIFSDYFAFGSVIFGFSKVKGGLLLNIYDYESKKNKLYFLSQNKMLLTENICRNAKFRPIKKNKRNWQNQIESVTFEY